MSSLGQRVTVQYLVGSQCKISNTFLGPKSKIFNTSLGLSKFFNRATSLGLRVKFSVGLPRWVSVKFCIPRSA